MSKELRYTMGYVLHMFVYVVVSAGDESSNGVDASHMQSFYFVRHGQTDWNANNRVPELTDYGLNAIGRQQAKDLCNHMADVTFAACFASDLKRAYDTASMLTNNQLEITRDARLRERDYGILQGQKIDEEKQTPEQLATIEKQEDFAQRITAFLQELSQMESSGPILVVSHAGCMRIMLASLLQSSVSESSRIAVKNMGYFKAHFCDDHWVIDHMQGIDF